MPHCRACSNEITRVRINKFTGKEEDLCSYCLSIARLAVYDMEPTQEDPDQILDWLEINDTILKDL